MTATDYFTEDPSCKIIGPQIGPVFDPCGVRITIALPHKPEIGKLTCRLFDARDYQVGELACQPLHSAWRHFLFEFTGLHAGKEYCYRFFHGDSQPLDLEAGLTEGDCRFHAPQFVAGDRFVLLSCNNPFHSGKTGDNRFAMWNRLLEKVSEDSNIKLVIQGGDQVYHDDIEKDCLAKLALDTIDEEGVVQSVIRNYQHYYGATVYRKVMARVPSVAMLDDHDITDGWGGRPESFNGNGSFRPEWEKYLDYTYSAFKAYQTAKNPPVRISDGVETTFLDFGGNRLYLLDLRREKNIRNDEHPLVSREHEEKLLESISSVPDSIRKVFVLSPVVAVRINPVEEESLEATSRSAYSWRLQAKEKLDVGASPRWWWSLVYGLSGIAGASDLTDDLTDGLSSKKNRKFLIGLVKRLAEMRRSKGVQPFVVSGDIHAGGISEIFVRDGEGVVCIPQIVSSPISHEPMNRTVKNSTTEEWDYEIVLERPAPSKALDGPEVGARNIFYRSDRNFCVVEPGSADAIPTADFHFENLKEPICCPVSFYASR